jgi:hypothetical protein
MTTDRFDEAWHAYAERERTMLAPAYLESRVLSAVKHARFAPPPARPSAHMAWLAAAATVVIGVAVAIRSGSDATTVPLSARAHTDVLLPAPVAQVRPQLRTAAPLTTANASDWIAREDELRIILMLFDATPALRGEPLQLVRLRLPREALQGLGVALLEPEAGGMVDVDVLVGEDGLPRDIRRIRQ